MSVLPLIVWPFHSDDGEDMAKGLIAAALIIKTTGDAVSDVGPALDRLTAIIKNAMYEWSKAGK